MCVHYFLRDSKGHIVMDGDEEGDSDSQSQADVLSEDAESGPVDMITKLRGRTGNGFTTNWGPVGFRKDRHPLSIMVSCWSRYCV